MNFSTVIDLNKISATYDNKSNNNPITVRFGFMFSFLILSRLLVLLLLVQLANPNPRRQDLSWTCIRSSEDALSERLMYV